MTSDLQRCDFRTYGECPCPSGTCQQQIQTRPPLHQPSFVTTISTAIIISAITAFFVFVSMPRAMEASHREALENQEQIHHG